MPGDVVALPGLQGLLDIAVRKMQNGNQVAVFSVCSLSLWERVGVRASNGISFWGNVPFTRPSASAFPQPFVRPEMPGGGFALPGLQGLRAALIILKRPGDFLPDLRSLNLSCGLKCRVAALPYPAYKGHEHVGRVSVRATRLFY